MSILVFCHQGPQVKILDVYNIIVCAWGADGMVEMELDGDEVGGGGGEFAIVLYSIPI